MLQIVKLVAELDVAVTTWLVDSGASQGKPTDGG